MATLVTSKLLYALTSQRGKEKVILRVWYKTGSSLSPSHEGLEWHAEDTPLIMEALSKI